MERGPLIAITLVFGMLAPVAAVAQQGDVYSSGGGIKLSSDPKILRLQVSNSAATLHHILSIEIESEHDSSGADREWPDSVQVVQRYLPACISTYEETQQQVRQVAAEFAARDFQAAAGTQKHAWTLLAQADDCSNKSWMSGPYGTPPDLGAAQTGKYGGNRGMYGGQATEPPLAVETPPPGLKKVLNAPGWIGTDPSSGNFEYRFSDGKIAFFAPSVEGGYQLAKQVQPAVWGSGSAGNLQTGHATYFNPTLKRSINAPSTHVYIFR